ncbi:MAG: M20/M25/M40 family metallo-hydrolase [Acidobacteria bacterium]|nr:M20/M25/M40 family metallo-hydrolase [Acidobacteriota bacterium]
MRWLALFLITTQYAFPDSVSNNGVRIARQWRESHERQIVDEFVSLLSLPNIARNRADMAQNAASIRGMLEKRGIPTQLLEAPGAVPAVFGEVRTPGATQTVMLYAHYDGQPVEPSQWITPPFRPQLRDAAGKPVPLAAKLDPEHRIYARSASDDKAPIVAFMTALDALRNARQPLRSNIKFFFDGEEEAGSPNIGAILNAHKQKLAADFWIFCDGPVHQSRRQQVVFGVRGTTGFNLTILGPKRELHSGHYGNWAANPVLSLAHLMTTMRDESGRILIDGFYDDVEPLSESEKRAIAAMPDIGAGLQQELALGRLEGNGKRLEELIALPALNFRGISAAGVGPQSRNVIPERATVSVDIRLVRGMDHRRAIDKVRRHLKKQGCHVVTSDPDPATRAAHPKVCLLESRESGYNAVRASMDSPIGAKVIDAVRSAHSDLILTPTMGGSLPISPIAEIMRTPIIIVPIANHDNNQHGHNENIRLQNLWDGIETMAALLLL